MKVLFYIKYITILNDKEEKIWGFLHHQSVQHTGKLKNKKKTTAVSELVHMGLFRVPGAEC